MHCRKRERDSEKRVCGSVWESECARDIEESERESRGRGTWGRGSQGRGSWDCTFLVGTALSFPQSWDSQRSNTNVTSFKAAKSHSTATSPGISYMDESCHTYKPLWVTNMDTPCHVWTSRVTYPSTRPYSEVPTHSLSCHGVLEWSMSCINKSSHACKWAVNVACHTREWGRYRQLASIGRLLKIVGLFCKRALEKRQHSAKRTYNLKEPTNQSHPIPRANTASSKAFRLFLLK